MIHMPLHWPTSNDILVISCYLNLFSANHSSLEISGCLFERHLTKNLEVERLVHQIWHSDISSIACTGTVKKKIDRQKKDNLSRDSRSIKIHCTWIAKENPNNEKNKIIRTGNMRYSSLVSNPPSNTVQVMDETNISIYALTQRRWWCLWKLWHLMKAVSMTYWNQHAEDATNLSVNIWNTFWLEERPNFV